MSERDDLSVTGRADLAALEHTDALLDRLGRRQPDAPDLDDPLAAALAVLAGDVDLRQVPDVETRRAMVAFGVWPLPEAWGPITEPLDGLLADDESVRRERRARDRRAEPPRSDSLVPRPIVCPRSAPDAGVGTPAAVGRGRRAAERRSGERRQEERRVRPGGRLGASSGGPSRPGGAAGPGRSVIRVVRLRSSFGLVAAAVLVVLGGGISAVFSSGDTVNPLTGLTSAVQRWSEGSAPATHDRLEAKVAKARGALQHGRRDDAADLIKDVRADIGALDGSDQQDLAVQIARLEAQISATEPRDGSGAADGDDAPEAAGGDADDSAERSSSARATTGSAARGDGDHSTHQGDGEQPSLVASNDLSGQDDAAPQPASVAEEDATADAASESGAASYSDGASAGSSSDVSAGSGSGSTKHSSRRSTGRAARLAKSATSAESAQGSTDVGSSGGSGTTTTTTGGTDTGSGSGSGTDTGSGSGSGTGSGSGSGTAG